MPSFIRVDITSLTGGDAPVSWGTVPSLSATGITIVDTDSVCLIVAQIKQLDGTDYTFEARLKVNGSVTGSPVLTSFIDGSHTSSGGNGGTLIWAVDGLSGSSNSFSVEWQRVQSTSSIDTAYEHTLQVIEISGGDAEILVDQSSSGSGTSTASWANLFSATSISIASTASVVLMIANVPALLTGGGDQCAEFRFSVDGTREGGHGAFRKDAADDASGVAMMHVLDGISGSHGFELQWTTRLGTNHMSVDTARLRTFQVVEISANAILQIEKLLTSSGTAPVSYATMTGMTDSYTPASSSSINLAIGLIAVAASSGSAETEAAYRLNMGGSQIGSELVDFQDNADELGSVCQIWAKSGYSTSTTFKWDWVDLGNNATPTLDTGRTRSFFVIEFTQETEAFKDVPLKISIESANTFKDIPLKITIESADTFKDLPLKISIESSDTFKDLLLKISINAGETEVFKDVPLKISIESVDTDKDLPLKISVESSDTYKDISLKMSVESADTDKDLALKISIDDEQFKDLPLKISITSNLTYKDVPLKISVNVEPPLDWYGASWQYRKKHSIKGTSAGAQTDYQIPITVHYGSGSDGDDDVYCSSNCKTDFGDLRFTGADGETALDYWIESKTDSDQALIWVKVSSIPASPDRTQIYTYWGNSSATTTSNGDNTFIFFDHFPGSSLDSGKWTVRSGAVTVADSNLELTGVSSPRGLIDGKTTFIVEKRIRLRARWDTASGQGCSFLTIRSNGGWNERGGNVFGGAADETLTLRTTHLGISTDSAETDIDTPTDFHTYHLTWEADETTVYQDDNFLVANTDNIGTGSQVTAFFESSISGVNVDVDWIHVDKWTNPEPTHGAWFTEENQNVKDISLKISIESADTFKDIPLKISISVGATEIFKDLPLKVSIYAEEFKDVPLKVSIESSDTFKDLPIKISVESFETDKDLSLKISVESADINKDLPLKISVDVEQFKDIPLKISIESADINLDLPLKITIESNLTYHDLPLKLSVESADIDKDIPLKISIDIEEFKDIPVKISIESADTFHDLPIKISIETAATYKDVPIKISIKSEDIDKDLPLKISVDIEGFKDLPVKISIESSDTYKDTPLKISVESTDIDKDLPLKISIDIEQFKDVPIKISIESADTFKDIPLKISISTEETFKDLPLRISTESADIFKDLPLKISIDIDQFKDVPLQISVESADTFKDILLKITVESENVDKDLPLKITIESQPTFKDLPLKISIDSEIETFKDLPLKISIESQPEFKDIPLKISIESSDTYKDLPFKISVESQPTFKDLPLKISIESADTFKNLPIKINIESQPTFKDVPIKITIESQPTFKDLPLKISIDIVRFKDLPLKITIESQPTFKDIPLKVSIILPPIGRLAVSSSKTTKIKVKSYKTTRIKVDSNKTTGIKVKSYKTAKIKVDSNKTTKIAIASKKSSDT